MVQLLIKEVELETSETCFLLLRCGAQWGRSITLPSSKTHNFNWEVRLLHAPRLRRMHALLLSACLHTRLSGLRTPGLA